MSVETVLNTCMSGDDEMNTSSDLYRLAQRAANWMTYDQDVVFLCREALLLGFNNLCGKYREISCAGYLHGEAQAREAWETFWSQ